MTSGLRKNPTLCSVKEFGEPRRKIWGTYYNRPSFKTGGIRTNPHNGPSFTTGGLRRDLHNRPSFKTRADAK